MQLKLKEMKKIILSLIAIVFLISCSKSESEPAVADETPNAMCCDYVVKNTDGSNKYYIYFSNTPASSFISQKIGSITYTNFIIWTYNKPNGTIKVGTKMNSTDPNTNNLFFKENSTYNFSVNGKVLTIEGQILVKES